MFASGTGSMRGPRVKTPLLLLLLLAALTKTVLCDNGDAAADDEAEATEIQEEEAVEAEVVQEVPGADGGGDGNTEISETTPATTDDSPTVAPGPSLPVENIESPIEDDHGSGIRSLPSLDDVPTEATLPYSAGPGDISQKGGEEGLSLIIILIPVVLVVLIIGMIVCGIFINRRWNEKARNQELRKEDPYLDGSSTEKVPMPMFEEDVPSVLELEMEELDQWMKTDDETAKDSTLA
ncbi:transmembrane protein 154 isoform X1 [Epinephelus fuscoguttatus]|uniref:transmembrane protein 154 isoform X1 n=1 Tax=Epinephelus fuscoguttatus TaxID=293821 RepID=UPI0020D181D6|nr:transmembrane protein 154 isoform X1 [Epinephelus fuscoguttatus]